MLDHLKNSASWLQFRLRLARAGISEETEVASREELEALVSAHTEWWENRGPLRSFSKSSALAELNRRSDRTYIFSVRAGKIRIWDKVPRSLAVTEARRPGQLRLLARRAGLCRIYLEHVLRMSGSEGSFDFALNVGDRSIDTEAFPVFGFEKHVSGHSILLPDTDFFDYDWYRHDDDPLAYEAKKIRACFAGASTGGGLLNAEAIRNPHSPRLRAAAYFHGNPDVLFRITAAVRCTSPDVESLLREQPYFGAPVPWREQLRNRFIISMDGNGATWSRMARGLLSNSAVIKFHSPSQLFYFPALEAGREYISVNSEAEVEPIIQKEREQSGAYSHVAQAGHLFAKRFLNAASVFSYTALLMRRIALMQ